MLLTAHCLELKERREFLVGKEKIKTNITTHRQSNPPALGPDAMLVTSLYGQKQIVRHRVEI